MKQQHQPSDLELDYQGAVIWAEEVAAKWLEARASGDPKRWRMWSDKLDEALAEANRAEAAMLTKNHQ